MDRRIYCLVKRIEQNSAGLGLSFENISAEWLKAVLKAEGVPNISIITNKKFEDSQQEVFRILFSENSFIAIEYSSFTDGGNAPRSSYYFK